MGIHITFAKGKDHPDIAAREEGKIFVNDIGLNEEEIQLFKDALIYTIKGDISLTPKCACRHTSVPLYTQDATACPICNTVPKKGMEGNIEPIIYLRKPLNISGLISYNFWNMMRNLFNQGRKGKNSNSMLRWVTDPSYVLTQVNAKLVAERFTAMGIKRGYNNFIENMGEYLELMSSDKAFKTKEARSDILELYKKEKRNIHCNFLPFMDSMTRILEKTGGNDYAAEGFSSAIDAIMGVVGIDDERYTDVRREGMMARFMENYTVYWDTFLDNTIKGKYGFIRRTLYNSKGTRITRLVLSSITEPHKHYQIELPWIAMIYTLETPITSVLLKKGMTLAQIREFIQHCSNNYNKTMHSILDKLVADCKDSIGCTLQRYPTLKRGSMLFLDAGRYKIIPEDRTVSLSPLAVRTLNADYDGDLVHVNIFLDDVMKTVLEPLRYHYNCLDNSMPRTISNVELTVPLETNLLKWYEDADCLVATPEETAEMVALLG